jgi:multicomponent Na+:H+ antiporter subunit C
MNLFEQLGYFVMITMVLIGLSGVILYKNLFSKVIGINIIQAAVVFLFIGIWINNGIGFYPNRLLPVLLSIVILSAVTTTVLGFRLAGRIREAYRSVDENQVLQDDRFDS